jgi:hypothetical protein
MPDDGQRFKVSMGLNTDDELGGRTANETGRNLFTRAVTFGYFISLTAHKISQRSCGMGPFPFLTPKLRRNNSYVIRCHS